MSLLLTASVNLWLTLLTFAWAIKHSSGFSILMDLRVLKKNMNRSSLLFSLLLMCGWNVATAQQCSRPLSYFQTQLRVGAKAPEFHLKDTDGNTKCLRKLEGRKTVLAFFSKEDKNIAAILDKADYNKGQNKDLQYVFVCVDGDNASIKKLAQSLSLQGSYLVPATEVVEGYNKQNLPLILVLDEKSTILYIKTRDKDQAAFTKNNLHR